MLDQGPNIAVVDTAPEEVWSYTACSGGIVPPFT